MSPRFRRARIKAAVRHALSACALALASDSLAQTWVNPNSGTWSDTANWVGATSPNSLSGTQLTFNVATGESYVANNDIADPFTLNAIIFNAQAGGTINLTGGQLLFDGISPTIDIAGAGAVDIANAIQIASTGLNTDAVNITGIGTGSIHMAGTLSSSVAPTPTGGGAIDMNAASATLRMSGGGTLFALRGSSGTIALDGGTWNLTSTQRRYDVLLGVDDGPWALSLGEVANQPTFFEMNGGTMTAPQAFVAAVPNSISTATFTDGALADFSGSLGRFGVNAGAGTINVLNGAHVITRFFEHGRQDGSTAVGLVDGTGSRIDCTNFVVARGPLCHGTMTISNGGVIAVNGNTYLSYLSPQESFNGSALLTVDGAGSQLAMTGDIYCGLASNATLSISNSASVTAHNIFMGYQNPNEAGTILIQGGSLVSSGQLLMRSTTTRNLIQVTAGTFEMNGAGAGSFVNALVGAGFGGNSQIDVSGPDARFLQTGASTFMIASGGLDTYAPVSTLSISNGGLMQIGTGGLFLASAEAAHATISVSGTNSRLVIGGAGSGDFVAAQAGTDTFEVGSVARVSASAGGAIEVAGGAFFSPISGSLSDCLIDAGTLTVAGQLHLGGTGGMGGGTCTLDVTNGGFVSSGSTAVYSNATVTIGSGLVPAMFVSSGGMSVDGHVVFNSGTLSVAGELTVGGSVVLSDAARDLSGTPQNKKVIEAGSISFTTSGFIDVNDNDAIIHNNTLSEVENFIRTGRNGGLWDGTMLVSTAAKNHPSQTTGLGAITGADFHSAAGGTALFSGREVADTDILVKYTYNGDTDFDGKVSGADYARIDTSFNNETSMQTDIGGWFNGDFDFNGKVDGADYALIDSGFNSQDSVLARGGGMIAAGPGDRVITSALWGDGWNTAPALPEIPAFDPVASAFVPEPGAAVAIVALVGSLSRRYRRMTD